MKRLLAILLLAATAHADVPAALDAIARVGREGEGNDAASAAWKELTAAGPAALPAILAATGRGSVVADNWLRLAADTIVARAASSGTALPLGPVEDFLKNTAGHPAGRVLAFDIIRLADAKRADEIEPSLAGDPVQELRRGAVQRRIEAARKAGDGDAKAAWLASLDAARDEDQTKIISAALKSLGSPVDLAKHFGFLTTWRVIGPFDNTERKGFDTVYPPEKEITPDATYDGKDGPVKWQTFTSTHELGKVDFNKPLGMLKESVGYAVTTFHAAEAREAEIRLGCKNAWKVWVNGELLFGRDEYHRGQQMDQYKLRCRLKQGANTILVKCCQNEQKEEWTVEWEFQLRVCDSTGTAIHSAK